MYRQDRNLLIHLLTDPILFSGTLRSNLDPWDEHDDATLWQALKRSGFVHEEDDHSNGSSGETASRRSSTSNAGRLGLDTPVATEGSNFSQGASATFPS